MSKGPSNPTIKRYLKLYKSEGFNPTSAKMSANGDVSLYFEQSDTKNTNQKDLWEIEIEKP